MKRNNSFYEKIKILTRMNNMSINQLEASLNLPRNALNNYKNGGTPSVCRALQVANYFGISVEELFQNECGVIGNVEYVFKRLDSSQKLRMHQLCNKWFIEQEEEALHRLKNYG